MPGVRAALPDGLRDRKKQQTRDQLQRAAMVLFAARGFDHVTVEEIAAACDVSRATVFRYFPTKEDLVVGSEPERLAELREAFEERPGHEPVFESVRHALVAVAGRYEHDRGQLLVARGLVAGHGALLARALELQAEWTEVFAELIADRVATSKAPDLQARVLAAAVMAAMRVAVEHWLDTDAAGSPAELLGEALDLLEHGFVAG